MRSSLRLFALISVVVGVVWLSGDRARGFSYFNYGGTNVVWPNSTSLRCLSPGTFPEGEETDILIQLSMGQWTFVWGGGFEYTYYRLPEDPVVDHFDGYSDTAAVPSDWLDPGVLGVTYMVNDGPSWFDMDIFFSDFPEGVGWHMLTDPDCEVTANPTPDNGFSFYLVATHELGHAIGLGHDPIGDEPAGSPWFIATMNPGYPAGGPVGQNNVIELHTDDRRGVRYLYPGTPETKVDLANASYCTAGPRLGKVVPLFVEPQVITSGEELTAWSVIENFGTVSVLNVRQGFYFSTDDVVDTGDLLVGDTRWDLSADDGIEFSLDVDVPDLVAGTYYFGSMLDDLNEITEEYEDNNDAITCEPFTLEQGIPSFAPTSQQVITCDQPFSSPLPAVYYPINTAPITWSIDNPQPGMTIDEGTGVISWPNPVKSPIEYHIDVRATNAAGTYMETLDLAVLQSPPRIVPIPEQIVPCESAYTGPTPILTAPTCMAPILNWALLEGPSGMTIDNGSGIVSWPLADVPSSPIPVTIQATNAAGTTVQSWNLVIGPNGGDLDESGFVGMEDVNPFVTTLLGIDPGVGFNAAEADLNCDGNVDGMDIQPFLGLLLEEGVVLGACCYADGTCTDETAGECYGLGGIYRGNNTTCGSVDCTGACCFYTGGCLDFIQDSCDVAGGTFQGMGTLCVEVTCPPAGQGACCLPDETCTITTMGVCNTLGGAYQGTGMSCDAVDCSTPIGACCHDDGSCSEGTADDCTLAGGTYLGNGVGCNENICLGACCYATGGCLDLSEPNCAITGGSFKGSGTACATTECVVEATGACCYADETCQPQTGSMCVITGGSYQGDETQCAETDCTAAAIGACCLPDESCIEVTAAACGLAGGVFIGDMTDCATVDCQLTDIGACYDPVDWSCMETSLNICTAMGGTFEGVATTCSATTAPEYLNSIATPTTFWTPGAGVSMADDMTLAGTSRGLTYFDLAVYGTGGGTYGVTVGLYDDCPGEGGVLIDGTEVTWTEIPADDFIYTISTDFFASPIRIPDTVWMAATFTSANAGWVVAEEAEIGSTEDLYGDNNPSWVCDYWFGGPPNDYAGFLASIQCVYLPDPEGACCQPDESCSDAMTQVDCNALGGMYMGEGSLCSGVICTGLEMGACCDMAEWTCSIMTATDCAAAAGSYDGNGTNCVGACPEYLNDIAVASINYNPGKPMADDLVLTGLSRELSYFQIAVYGGGGGNFDISTAFYDASPCSGGEVIPGSLVSGNGLPDNGDILFLNVTFPTPVTLPDDVWLVVEFSTPFAGWIVAEEAEAGFTTDTFSKATYNPGTETWDWSCAEQIDDPDNPYAGFWTVLQCVEPGAGYLASSGGTPMLTVMPMEGAGAAPRLAKPVLEPSTDVVPIGLIGILHADDGSQGFTGAIHRTGVKTRVSRLGHDGLTAMPVEARDRR